MVPYTMPSLLITAILITFFCTPALALMFDEFLAEIEIKSLNL